MSEITLRGMGAMVSRNFRVYRATWYVNAVPPLAEPFLYLLALGYGLGALIESVGGYSYAQYIAPAIIGITAMQTAFMETTYSSYVRMYYQKTWDAVMATPLSAGDILAGEVLWAATRSAINATLMSLVVAAFGLLSFPEALAIPPVAFFVGLAFAGIGLFVASKVKVIDQFSYAFFLFITPMFLFSGTFFPLEQLPGGVRHLAYALPLTHAVQLMRSLALDSFTWLTPWSMAYLVVAAFTFPAIAIGSMRRRIVN